MSKSGREIGADYVARLNTYLSSVDVIPSRAGKANMTAIAEACGFDRQTLYKNSIAKELLQQAIATKGLAGTTHREEKVDTEHAALERQVTKLQQTNSALLAEVYELRVQLKRLRHVEQVMEQGSRIIP